MINVEQALQLLKEGNQRYLEGYQDGVCKITPELRNELAQGQMPFAVILGCSDSRVPAEMVFDQGLGDLFVIRVAGNIVAPSQVASVEFAVESFGTPLVIVLGHSQCGAVSASLDLLRTPSETDNKTNLGSIVERIKPAISDLVESNSELGRLELLDKAVAANIQASVEQLSKQSKLLQQAIAGKKLKIVGAEYCLDTGKVSFLDE